MARTFVILGLRNRQGNVDWMQRHRWIAALLAVVLIVTSAGEAEADEPFSAIVLFGDSLSDTGNAFAATGIPPTGPDNFPYFEGRFSNGPIWIDRVQQSTGLSDEQILNFAFGGASTGFGLKPPPEGIFSQPPAGIPTVGLQIATFLQVAQPEENQLFVVWAGSNDLVRGERPAVAALNLELHVRALAGAGATEFLVPNSPPLGSIPLLNDSFFGSLIANIRTIRFNSQLDQRLDALEQELGITIHRLDVFTLTSLATLFPSLLGFIDGENSALQDIADGRITPAQGANYVFWDSIHPTSKSHNIIGIFALLSLGQPLN